MILREGHAAMSLARRRVLCFRAAISPKVERSRLFSLDAHSCSDEEQDDDLLPIRKAVTKTGKPVQRIFSGIQPTGIPHLGNYLGALRPWKDLQDKKSAPGSRQDMLLKFCIVDLHALTVQQDPALLNQWRHETAASLLAVGLDPKHSTIFYQSAVHYHAELMWILSTIASTGYLSRMTQWKSKLEMNAEASLDDEATRAKLKLGLFSYPVLQAADILLYNTTHVPIGEDQLQHIELARSLAASFNHRHGDVFTVPQASISPAKRIMSLKEPTKKMSKSHREPKSRILISDGAEEIQAKIRVALTDSEPGISYDPERRPGVSNLVEVLKHVQRNPASCAEIAADCRHMPLRAFKEHVAAAVADCLAGVRDRFHDLIRQPRATSEVVLALRAGHQQAAATAGNTMRGVNLALGIRNDGAGSIASGRPPPT